jgi:hypothetical protein
MTIYFTCYPVWNDSDGGWHEGLAYWNSYISRFMTLNPGDVIFTGTPDGVGLGMTPQRFLQPGETLRTWAEGIGEMQHTFRWTAAPDQRADSNSSSASLIA